MTPVPATQLQPAVPAWRRAMRTQDVDAHISCQPGWELNYEQLSAGAFNGSIDHLHLSGINVLREGANLGVRQIGQMNSGGYGFALPLTVQGQAFFSGQRLSMHSAMIGPSDDLELCSQGPFWMVGMTVDADVLSDACWRIFNRPPPRWLHRQRVFDLAPDVSLRMRSTLEGALDLLAARPTILEDTIAWGQVRDHLLLTWLTALPEQPPEAQDRSSAARRRVVHQASAMILQQHDEPLSLLKLCTTLGVSERKLNYCFQHVVGMSPARYLRVSRLNGVRRELKRAAGLKYGVQDIAAHWGFWHLGQFSADYKRLFGELPSLTLNRARAEHTSISVRRAAARLLQG